MTTNPASPPVWFRLPPGFHDVSPSDRAALDEIAYSLGSPDAQGQLARLMDGLTQLDGHRVVHTALGLHPDDPTGVCTSLFSLTIRPTGEVDLNPILARTALAIAESSLWTSSLRRPVELPSALPCYLIAGTMALPGTGQQLFQARVATAHADGRHILVLDLTSAAIHHADGYTDIIEAIAHTVSFTDPAPSRADSPGTSRVLEVLQ
ncbi:hypothetical protein Slala04_04890 [Streptomyces lavendulae subsp. lavendulae]|nr:hypothetical protein Slala04_04890 [Streptomyces lavendulae subsp. lavendulae]